MLDSIRQLTRAMKLKDLIIGQFIPENIAKSIEKRATWIENEDGDGWIIPVTADSLYDYVYFMMYDDIFYDV